MLWSLSCTHTTHTAEKHLVLSSQPDAADSDAGDSNSNSAASVEPNEESVKVSCRTVPVVTGGFKLCCVAFRCVALCTVLILILILISCILLFVCLWCVFMVCVYCVCVLCVDWLSAGVVPVVQAAHGAAEERALPVSKHCTVAR